MSGKLVFLSGLSGTGKTTIGKAFVEKYKDEGWIFKDQDDFFRDEKPKVTLSNGSVKSNWDCKEALDFQAINEWLYEHRDENVMFVGFALIPKWVFIEPTVYIDLSYDGDYDERCIENRKKSKGYEGKKAEDDILMVKEVIMPFYIYIIKNESVETKVISVYIKNKRKTVEILVNEVRDELTGDWIHR